MKIALRTGVRGGFPSGKSGLAVAFLTAAGFAGNYFSLPLFFSVGFLFGSIPVLLISRLYGATRGTLAAFLAGSCTYVLWGHPYGMLILTFEALFVGLMLRRKRKTALSQNLLLLDTLYWLLAGMPMVWLFYYGAMEMTTTATVLIMLKQSVNGIFNALLAGLILAHLPVYKWAAIPENREKISFREIIFNFSVALVLVPTLLVMVQSSVLERPIGGDVPWSLAVEIPVAPYQNHLYTVYVKNLAITLSLALVALVVGAVVSRLLTAPVSELARITTGLSRKVLDGEAIGWPESTVSEMQALVANFKVMAGTLSQSFQELKDANQALEHIAYHDSLTELPNSLLFNQTLEKALSRARREHHRLAVFFVDLDNFKTINDSLGHDVGDALLKSVAKRLANHIRNEDTLARRGGDEFIILFPALKSKSEVPVIAQRVLKAFSDPFTLNGKDYCLTASTGVSIYPENGKDLARLVKTADFAMYRAKSQGGNTYQFFGPNRDMSTPDEMTGDEMDKALQRSPPSRADPKRMITSRGRPHRQGDAPSFLIDTDDPHCDCVAD